MPEDKIKIVLVDTNCFIRLFHSSAHPIFGQEIGGYKLLTLDCLIDEYLNSPILLKNFPWIAKEPRFSELNNAKLKLRRANNSNVQKQIKELRPYARGFLELFCKKQGISTRSLSNADIELLATTVALNCIMATDEWPLRYVAIDLMEDPDEYKIGILNSMELLHLLEENTKISPEERRKTVDSWIRSNENLLRGWQQDYQKLFNESADGLGM